jgi:hypothetical protein
MEYKLHRGRVRKFLSINVCFFIGVSNDGVRTKCSWKVDLLRKETEFKRIAKNVNPDDSNIGI